VANWRGHLRVVALLLLKGAILEPKTAGNKAKPNQMPERNYTIEDSVRSTLSTIYRAFETNEVAILKEIIESADFQKKHISTIDPLPLWAVIGLPKEEIPPQYMKSEYIWYRKIPTENKMTLMPLTISSHLTAVYMKNRKSSTAVTSAVPAPPSATLFNNTYVWSYEEWTIDFNAMSATIYVNNKNTKINLALISRTKLWYYSSSPGTDGPFVPFSNTICNKISAAYSSSMPAVQFQIQLDKGFFARTSICRLNFEKKECSITTGDNTTTHKLLIEDEYKRITNWEPEEFLPRLRPEYERTRVTFVEISPNTPEWNRVKEYFYLTMPQAQNGLKTNELVKIQRIFYPIMAEIFDQNVDRAREIHSGNIIFQNSITYKTMLWHGTGNTDPSIIATTGWKINYSSDKNLWGKGSYFASDAVYSAAYAFQDKVTGNKKMFLAQVITGLPLQCLENGNIKDVPKGYNSLLGFRHGSWIYILYDNQLAFPSYLVEWKAK